MKLTLNYKDGNKLEFSEDETKSLLKQINYLKVMMYLSNPNKLKGKKIALLRNEINTENLNSVEFVL